jgi:glutamate N-acetyltransferase/amino-acid N-acetyltransferase
MLRLSLVAMQRMLARVVEVSFNRISVDGDTSTNDTVLLLASGRAGRGLDSGGIEGLRRR